MEPHATVGVPAGDPLVDEAWKLAAAEQMGTVAMLIVAVVVLWRLVAGVFGKMQAQLDRLIEKQIESIGRVEAAIVRLDSHFSAAAQRLDRHEGRLDRAEQSIGDHSQRIRLLEHSAESGTRRRAHLHEVD